MSYGYAFMASIRNMYDDDILVGGGCTPHTCPYIRAQMWLLAGDRRIHSAFWLIDLKKNEPVYCMGRERNTTESIDSLIQSFYDS